MEKAKNFDELMHDESFLNKLNEAKSPEEAEEMCAAQGFDLNSELSGLPEGELSDEQLDSVAGGGISWGLLKPRGTLARKLVSISATSGIGSTGAR